MKTNSKSHLATLCLAALVATHLNDAHSLDILVKPSRGGGLDTNSPMIHVDISYDYANNRMNAILDTNYGVPKLVPLPPGYAFDSRSNYYVLTGKAYSLQYAWNPGGVFTNPPGAAIWIERLSASPGLENYDGPGNKNENPPRPYTQIFSANGDLWRWYGRMAHNAFAIRNPATNFLSAEYRVYFGDATTGSRVGFEAYDDATVTLTWTVDPVILTGPSRGGGTGTNMPPMIHVDIAYDYANNVMHAALDTNYGIAKLLPLPLGYAFDTRSNYSVLNGKSYNYQYAWNPGGVFTNPPGAAIWIERLNISPGLENYDGPGNKMENPPRTWAPILGTAGTPTIWKWYGRMAHNAYAIVEPRTNILTAQFRVYFGDATNGSRAGFEAYDDAIVDLMWTVDPVPESPVFRIGAMDTTNGAPLCFLNAQRFAADSGCVVTLHETNAGPCAGSYEGSIPMLAVPATAANGGPVANHAAPGSRLELQFVSLSGPAGGSLGFWESGEASAKFSIAVGEGAGTNCVCVSTNQGEPGCDPYGQILGRRFAVTQPGLYCLGFRVLDVSGNGPGGGPIHAPSELHFVHLQAGVALQSLTRQGTTVTAVFAGEPGKNFYLERATSLDVSAPWQVVGAPIRGFDRLQVLKDPAATSGQSFYRLRTSLP